MTACPPAEWLLAFAAGPRSGSQELRAAVEAHIDECDLCRATLSELARRDLPPPCLGRYRLDGVLGAGGMGLVYRAWDPQLARAVAIKVVKQADGDPAAHARLVREAQSLARLSHANVCQVYDVGLDGDEVWVAMELLDSVTLRLWAGEHRDRDKLLAVLLAAAEGLAAAHAAAIIHRDVKPENVLVTRQGRAVVTDFGLARVTDPALGAATTADLRRTAIGVLAGTPAYLAPEQLTGEPVDPRTDQFAWAVMAWELLAGVRPFPVTPSARLDAIRAGVAPPAALPRPLADGLSRALAAAPRDRFPSMRALIDAISAPPRQRRVAGAIALGVVAVGVGVGVGIGAWRFGAEPPGATPPLVASERSAPATPSGPATLSGPPIPSRQTAPGQATSGQATPGQATPSSPATTPAPGSATVATPPPPARSPMAATRERARPHEPDPPVKRAPPSPEPAVVQSSPAVATAVGAEPKASAAASAPAAPPRTDRERRFPKLSHAAAVALFVETGCQLPVDAAAPDPGLSRDRSIADWGRVTRHDIAEVRSDRGEAITMSLYEIAGQRGTYQIDGDMRRLPRGFSLRFPGWLDAQVGDLVVICPLGAIAGYQPPAPWRALTAWDALVPVVAPPRTTELAALAPLPLDPVALHSRDVKLQGSAQRRYLVYDTVKDGTSTRWSIGARGSWWLDVPPSTRGAELLGADKHLWFVVEQPTLEPVPGATPAQGPWANATTERAVWRAAAVIDDMFPH